MSAQPPIPQLPASLGLARRYRPRTFATLTGQRHVAAILGRKIHSGTIPQQMLFVGGSGLGKTTVARIAAASILCETPLSERPTGDACDSCESCRDITWPGRTHPDVIELDAASNGRIEEIREIAARAQLAPMRGAYKIYIIDEAHGLSGPGGEAFLKLLEEPPSHVIFMLATTNPEKMLATNRGRCELFELHRPTDAELAANLDRVASAEGVELEPALVSAVIEATDPALGVRGTLMSLGKLLPSLVAGEKLTLDELGALLGLAPAQLVSELTLAIESGNRSGMALALDELRSRVSEETLRAALIRWARARFAAAAHNEPGAPSWEESLRRYELLAAAPAGTVGLEIALARISTPALDASPGTLEALLSRAETALVQLASGSASIEDASRLSQEAATSLRESSASQLAALEARVAELTEATERAVSERERLAKAFSVVSAERERLLELLAQTKSVAAAQASLPTASAPPVSSAPPATAAAASAPTPVPEQAAPPTERPARPAPRSPAQEPSQPSPERSATPEAPEPARGPQPPAQAPAAAPPIIDTPTTDAPAPAPERSALSDVPAQEAQHLDAPAAPEVEVDKVEVEVEKVEVEKVEVEKVEVDPERASIAARYQSALAMASRKAEAVYRECESVWTGTNVQVRVPKRLHPQMTKPVMSAFTAAGIAAGCAVSLVPSSE